MEKENKRKSCYLCKYFNMYYSHGYNKFCKTKYGLCILKDENTEVDGNCEKFEIKPLYNRNNRFIRVSLNGILMEIEQVREVLQKCDPDYEIRQRREEYDYYLKQIDRADETVRLLLESINNAE